MSEIKELKNLPKETIKKMEERNVSIYNSKIRKTSISKDGTRKYLINFGSPNEEIETVYIPEEKRGSLVTKK